MWAGFNNNYWPFNSKYAKNIFYEHKFKFV